MGITHDGWLTWATRVPGPPEKIYSAVNKVEGYVPHSAVGYLDAWLRRLRSMERDPNNPARFSDFAAASMHGWIPKRGKVLQHYSFFKSCWGSGHAYPNTHFPAFENEGGPPGNESEPLTEFQLEMNERIIWELSEWKGWKPTRPRGPSDTSASLYEHNECRRWGSAPTACPSGRMTELWVRVEETMKEIEDLKAALAFHGKIIVGNTAAIDFLSKIAVDHEQRIKDLETFGEPRVPPR